MEKAIAIAQLVGAVLLMIVILLQNKGTGLSDLFGGSGAFYRTKRGVEKYLSIATVVLAILFFGLSLANVLI